MDDYLVWGFAILIAIGIFKAGMSFGEGERRRKQEAEKQRDLDLGLLANILSQWARGSITRTS